MTTYSAASSPVAGGRFIWPDQQQIASGAAAAGSLTFGYSRGGSVFIATSQTDASVRVYRVRRDGITSAAIKTWGTVDIHNNAAILPLNDGRTLAMYCFHLQSQVYARRTATPGELDFGAEETVFAAGAGASYLSLYRAASGRIWLFYCLNANLRDIYYRTSDDDAVTWSAATRLWASSGKRPYFGVTVAGNDLLMAVASGNAYDYSPGVISGHYVRYSAADGQWVSAAGVAYTLPLTEAGTEKYFDAAVHSRNAGFNPWPALTPDNRPVIYIEGSGASTSRPYRCEWTGSAWSVNALPAETDGTYNPSSPVPGNDVNSCYLIRPTSGRGQVWKYQSADGGVSWSGEQMTTFASGNATQQIMRIAGNGPRWVVHQLSRSSNSTWSSVLHMGRN